MPWRIRCMRRAIRAMPRPCCCSSSTAVATRRWRQMRRPSPRSCARTARAVWSAPRTRNSESGCGRAARKRSAPWAVCRDLVVQDAVVPRSALPHVLEAIGRIAAGYGLTVSNVFHAGDGNLHPNISFDGRVPGLKARVEQASGEIMAVCIAAGGTITGEHGVGLDKLRYMPLIFDGDALAAMRAVRRVFDPLERVSPGKVVPIHACREGSGCVPRAIGPAPRGSQERSAV